MNPFRSLSASFQRLSRRERRVVTGGAALSLAALLVAWVLIPTARRWEDREAAIEARRARLSQLKTLVAGATDAERTLALRRQERGALRRRLVSGATPALAASNLQGILQGYAVSSRVSLDRVDVVAEPSPASDGLSSIPVQLVAQGDIYGVADFLSRVQYGGILLMVDEMRVSASPWGDGDRTLLNWSLRLRGVYTPE